MTIHLPPLRERKEDIPLLSEAILDRLKVQLNRPISRLSPRFLDKLCQHAWLGNVRELEHVLRRAALLEETPVLSGRFFVPQPIPASSSVAAPVSPSGRRLPKNRRADLAKAAVENAMGNKTLAAAELGISRKTLYAWLAKD
jgi:transcriptional regulator with PAS, ATPase and Fis domain